MEPKILTRFWADPEVEAQPPNIKLALLWLITNQQTSILGLCKPTGRRFEFETGLKHEDLIALPQLVPSIVEIHDGHYFLPSYIRIQVGAGESLQSNNIFKALLRAYSLLSNPLQKLIEAEYPEFGKGLPRAMEGLGKGKEKRREEQRGEAKRSEEGKGSGEGEPDHPWPQPNRPANLAEVLTYAQFIMMDPKVAEAFWDHFESSGWYDKNKNPVGNWQAKCRSWKTNHAAAPLEAAHGAREGGSGTDSNFTLLKKLDYVEKELQSINHRASHAAMETIYEPKDLEKRKLLLKQRKDIKARLGLV